MLVKMINGKAMVQPEGTKVSNDTKLFWVIQRIPESECNGFYAERCAEVDLVFTSVEDVKEFYNSKDYADYKERVHDCCKELKDFFFPDTEWAIMKKGGIKPILTLRSYLEAEKIIAASKYKGLLFITEVIK